VASGVHEVMLRAVSCAFVHVVVRSHRRVRSVVERPPKQGREAVEVSGARALDGTITSPTTSGIVNCTL